MSLPHLSLLILISLVTPLSVLTSLSVLSCLSLCLVNSLFRFFLAMTMITCSVGSLSVLTALTYPVGQSAWALAHSLIGELHAPCRNKLVVRVYLLRPRAT